MAYTKSSICNLALSRLGNYGSVSDIDTPDTDVEKVMAEWWDTIRKKTLKLLIPSFATARKKVSAHTEAPAFGWSTAYEYPDDCLKFLGIGEVQEKEINAAIEQLPSGKKAIMTEVDGSDGLPIRYIKDETDVSKFTDDFASLMSWELAYATCMGITKDLERLAYMENILPKKRSEMGAVDSQENRPIRISHSKFNKARYTNNPTNHVKR